ncbi:MAG: sulfur carrier protein ThiS [Desulfovibrio sp.]|nr:sulfur carrier protein ThiS [Desulfovibrio sp.]
MKIIANGEAKDVPEGATLLEYIRSLGLDENAVVAELNGNIIEKSSFGSVLLLPDDRLELLHFVGGG